MQLRKESLKKIQACTGFEPLTSAIPVQHSRAHIVSYSNLFTHTCLIMEKVCFISHPFSHEAFE